MQTPGHAAPPGQDARPHPSVPSVPSVVNPLRALSNTPSSVPQHLFRRELRPTQYRPSLSPAAVPEVLQFLHHAVG
jgi:hypothetical protein